MGAIARSIANNITTSGVFTSSAITNSSVTGITVLANATDGITFISSQTASNSASLSFTSGITSTYKAYRFILVNIKPATSGANFSFNGSTDSGSNYNVVKTTSQWRAYHNEGDTYTGLNLSGGLQQSTGFQTLGDGQEALSDSNGGGYVDIINPSSTTYAKHFFSVYNIIEPTPECNIRYNAGYFNTTSAVNAFRFQFTSGNISAGTIYLYGIK
jgi:hypothetical protein